MPPYNHPWVINRKQIKINMGVLSNSETGSSNYCRHSVQSPSSKYAFDNSSIAQKLQIVCQDVIVPLAIICTILLQLPI